MTLCIYGYGGHGLELEELSRVINLKEKRWENIIFAEDAEEKFDNKRVFGFEDIVRKYKASDIEFTVGVGEPSIREKLYEKIKERGYSLATLVHPSAFIASNAKIAEGAVVCFNAYIPVDAYLCENTLIQPMAVIGHNGRIGKNSVVAACAAMGGNTFVGENSFVGMGAAVRQGIKIGNNSVVGMGAIVTKDVPDNVLAVGNPAKIAKSGEIKAL